MYIFHPIYIYITKSATQIQDATQNATQNATENWLSLIPIEIGCVSDVHIPSDLHIYHKKRNTNPRRYTKCNISFLTVASSNDCKSFLWLPCTYVYAEKATGRPWDSSHCWDPNSENCTNIEMSTPFQGIYADTSPSKHGLPFRYLQQTQ